MAKAKQPDVELEQPADELVEEAPAEVEPVEALAEALAGDEPQPELEQPAPIEESRYLVRIQVGSRWMPGETITESDVLAWHGCDLARLLAIGAIERV